MSTIRNRKDGRRWFKTAVVLIVVALMALTNATESETSNDVALTACDAMPPGLIGFAPSTFGDAKRLDVQGDYAYLVDWSGSIMVFDISDPCHPSMLGSAQHTSQEFQDVTVEGNHAYIANDANGLAIYDVADPYAPSRVAARKDGGGYANSISYDGGRYAFISQLYSAGSELVIYDMTTFPLDTPTIYSPVPGWSHMWEVYAEGDRAYICAADGYGSLQFQILDVSALPAVPVLLGSLDLPVSSHGDGFNIKVYGDYAYLTTSHHPWHDGGLVVVNIADETAPKVEGEVFIPNSGIAAWKKPGLDIAGNVVYMTGRDGLYSFNVSDPSNPTQIINPLFTFPPSFGNTAGGDVVIRDDLAFTAVSHPEPWTPGVDHGGLAIYRLAANTAPTAVDDTFNSNANQSLNVAAPGVLTNDTDEDGDQLTAVKVIDPAHGTLTFNGDGSFIYKPAPAFIGRDTFTYKANDGTDDSNVATVSIDVTEPLIKLIESYAVSSVREGKPGDRACYWIISTVQLSGNVTIDITPQNGEIRVDKSPVILDPWNWNRLEYDGVNFVCIYTMDNSVDDGEEWICKDGTDDKYGTNSPSAANQECGDHQDFLIHAIVSSTDPVVGTGATISNNNPDNDLDNDPSTVDVLIADDDRFIEQLSSPRWPVTPGK